MRRRISSAYSVYKLIRTADRIRKHSFALIGIILGFAIFFGLFLRGENTRKEITKIETHVASPCSGLTERQCVYTLIRSLNTKDLKNINKRLSSGRVDTSQPSARVIRDEVRRQIKARKQQKSSGGGAPQVQTQQGAAPFQTTTTIERGSETTPVSPDAGQQPSQSPTVTSPKLPNETPTTTSATPTPTIPDIPPTPTPEEPGTSPPPLSLDPPPVTTPVTPPVDVPPVTVPCVDTAITNC